MRIVIFEAEPREAPAFEALKKSHEVVVTEQPLVAANAAEFAFAQAVSTFIYSQVDREVLARLPELALVATRSTGYDHIDTGACAQRGVAVTNVPVYGANTVAEHVFALLLAISHRLRDAIERARSGWFSPDGLEGFDLKDKVIGVVGTGHIGRHVVQIAKGFGMEVVAFDLRRDAALAADPAVRYVGFKELLALADVISLHVPGSPGGSTLLDAEAFAAMKPGVVIINTARGNLIDARELVKALRSGRVAAAGLDVLPDEPLIREEAELIASAFSDQHGLRNLVANHVLLHMPNVLVTPHSGFNTREAIGRITAVTIENIEAFANGAAQNVVNGPKRSPDVSAVRT
jgi:D-lactate dehydrogenase